MAKKLVSGPILAHSGCQSFFHKAGFVSHYTSWSAIIMYNIKKKDNNDPILRKPSDGRTDRGTEGRE